MGNDIQGADGIKSRCRWKNMDWDLVGNGRQGTKGAL